MKWMESIFTFGGKPSELPAAPTSGAASASWSGHAKQEAKEVLEAFAGSASRLAVLDRARSSATGFEFKRLANDSSGLEISKGKVNNEDGPHRALLEGLKTLDRRAVLLPEVYSAAAGRNVRFAAILPPGFDVTKVSGYPVVGVIPESPPGSTIPQLLSQDLLGKAESALKGRGLADAIVLVPERFEHRPGAVPAAELDRLARAVISEDLVPWTRKHLDGKSGEPTLVRHDFSAVSGGTVKGFDATASAGDVEESGPKRSFFDFSPRLLRELDDKKDGVLVRDRGDAEVRTLGSLEKVLARGGSELDFPDASDLKRLKDRKSPTLMVAKLEIGDQKVPVSVILPPGFDVERAKGYRPLIAAPQPELSAREVAKALRAKLPSLENTVVIVPDLTNKEVEAAGGKPAAAARALLEAGTLPNLERLNLDFGGYAVTELAASGKIDLSQAERPHLPGTMMNLGGEWRMLAPRSSFKQSYPKEPSFVTRTELIPAGLQKQPETHGTFFAPIVDSRAIKSPMRVGVYLPPGYDPAGPEKYPVLVLLPGKGSPLNVWTSEGKLTQRLDKLMGGDAQKMIVVVAGNTDSFWFDYDKNGKGSFGTPGKRDFEGLVMDELIGYATKELKGDASRLSIGGISRGGFGAMSLALRHPDKFVSVSAHSAPLALEHHEGVIGGPGAKSAVEHFGEPGSKVWFDYNPADLIKAGALKSSGQRPALLMDVGAQEPYFLGENLEFARLLDEAKVPHTLRVLQKDGKKLEHNWDVWGEILETWIPHHQAAHGGTPGKPRVPSGLTDVSAEAMVAHKASRVERREKAQTTLDRSVKTALDARDQARALLPNTGGFLPFENGASAGYTLRKVIDEAPKVADRAKAARESRRELPVLEALAARSAAEAEELMASIREAQRAINSGLGVKPPAPVADPKAIDRLPAPARKAVEELIQLQPGLRPSLELLATTRPHILSREDSVSGGRFAEQLRDFVADGKLQKGEEAGFGEFIRRMAVRRFDWRRGGYSRSTCSAMLSVFNHPGLILNMVRAARDGNDYHVKGLYSGDGARRLPPRDDFKAGFWPAPSTTNHPGAELGYERGWLRAVVDDLSGSPAMFPRQRFAAGCDADAVGLSKLVGEDVHYRYAFNLRTGADLVKALATQGEEGLAMADIGIRLGPNEPFHELHFPVFYDYDAKTQTVALQHWTAGERRIPVNELEFVSEGKLRPAIFFRGDESALHEILTPWEQKNWGAVKDAWKGPLPERLKPKNPDPEPPVRREGPVQDPPEVGGGILKPIGPTASGKGTLTGRKFRMPDGDDE